VRYAGYCAIALAGLYCELLSHTNTPFHEANRPTFSQMNTWLGCIANVKSKECIAQMYDAVATQSQSCYDFFINHLTSTTLANATALLTDV
jgi:hypothetical protein